ncbi:MAG: hypothetical protein COS99_06455 [Candidatus Omnitrophica bacterium CG07_land_8_20_14_0_80_42_15]|uniref:Uncharacterized protein n=1 Tax=Candidatus Aquitaenariimonas noxiae TaxID=1974741 RepID=A0A2J0KRM6_9BACT|nr:MAG: hypothetical protein COS99_06455 [Candidatus Omnitrophica bacterium CG07_land_8_20_14_0_80_42_15]
MRKGLISAIAFVAIVAMFTMLMPSIAQAEQGNKVANFFKKVFVYPFTVTKKTAEVAAKTTQKSAEMVVKTGEATAGVATGDLEKTKDLVVEPVKGSFETVGTAVEGSVKMPVEAAQEADKIVEGTSADVK